jgi:hypothetical protein
MGDRCHVLCFVVFLFALCTAGVSVTCTVLLSCVSFLLTLVLCHHADFLSSALLFCALSALSLSLSLSLSAPSGLCPGPSLVQMGTSSPLAQVFIPFMLLGMTTEELLLNQETTNQPINCPVNQSINCPVNQSINDDFLLAPSLPWGCREEVSEGIVSIVIVIFSVHCVCGMW